MKSDIQKTYILVLLIVSIGCLGSLPITSSMLETNNSHAQVPVVASPTYTDGQCTVSAVAHRHFSSTSAPASLPEVWSQAKRTHQDYVNALDCAATFVDTYESFDSRKSQTFTAAIPLLSAAAKMRFYEGYGKTTANVRTSSKWQMLAKLWHIVQTATSGLPSLQSSKYNNGTLYIVLNVPYQLSKQMAGKKTTRQSSVTVLLKEVAPDITNHGIGWQISDWRENEESYVNTV